MRTIQYRGLEGAHRVGIVRDSETIDALSGEQTLYDLALQAIRNGRSLAQILSDQPTDRTIAYADLIAERRILPPLDHPDPAHMLVTGTGLTHLGSADARDQMHKAADETLTDSMRMFQMGLERGKPAAGEQGVQPEWFYKGDGSIIVAPYRPLISPSFGLDGGEEPEIAGLYVIGFDSAPYRLGFALGNEFSDHVMEKQNYLYLAHSKLRPCAFGPELRLGELPQDVRGTARILRNDNVVWEAPFLSGERNMSHSIANLEYHHFKYRQFRRPGDVHVHFFGTATLSFAAGVVLSPGDEMEIEAEGFGRPLRNPYTVSQQNGVSVKTL
ncbi:MAG: AraD1 family protein [Anaerolineae bacterium]